MVKKFINIVTKKKLAPRLFAVQDLCDNWNIVVMEYLLPDTFESQVLILMFLIYNIMKKKRLREKKSQKLPKSYMMKTMCMEIYVLLT